MSWHNWHAVSAFITRSKIWRIVTAGACCWICCSIARIRVFQALRVIKARATWLPRNILTQAAFITRSKIWCIETAGACCWIGCSIARIRVFQALRVIKARATWLPRNILTQAAFITHFKTGKILTTLAAGRGCCAITCVGI